MLSGMALPANVPRTVVRSVVYPDSEHVLMFNLCIHNVICMHRNGWRKKVVHESMLDLSLAMADETRLRAQFQLLRQVCLLPGRNVHSSMLERNRQFDGWMQVIRGGHTSNPYVPYVLVGDCNAWDWCIFNDAICLVCRIREIVFWLVVASPSGLRDG